MESARKTYLLVISAMLASSLTLAACDVDREGAGAATEGGAPPEAAEPDRAADATALAGYDLSMEKLDGWFAAIQNVIEVVKRDSAIADRIAIGANDDVATASARLESVPEVTAAIEEAGLTAREYVLVNLALFQALFTHRAMQQGALQEVPEGVNAANVEFVKQHDEEITRRMRTLDAMAPGGTGGG